MKLSYNVSDQTTQSGESTNIAILGPKSSLNKDYTFEIKAESLKSGWNLEAADIVIKYDTDLFEEIKAEDITFGSSLTVAQAIEVDDTIGQIRIAASSLSNLSQGSSISSTESLLASIKVNFDEAYLATQTIDSKGLYVFGDSDSSNPLSLDLFANSDETVFSKTFDSDIDGKETDGGSYKNCIIKSIGDLNGKTVLGDIDLSLYESQTTFEETGNGLILGTQRVIGADAGFTNLIRKNDTVSAETTIKNIGNRAANNLTIEGISLDNASFEGSRFLDSNSQELSHVNLEGGSFDGTSGTFDDSNQQSTTVNVDVKATGEAGSVINLNDGIFKVSTDENKDDPENHFKSSSGSKNLITYQGDLNYDGRVSMKDLAYLNAGAARQNLDGFGNDAVATTESYARDVDADFNGKIDLADLAVLDSDWGESLHTDASGTAIGDEDFTGQGSSSSLIEWSELSSQFDPDTEKTDGSGNTWSNDPFTSQNAIENDTEYVESFDGMLDTGTGNALKTDIDTQDTQNENAGIGGINDLA